MAVFLGQGEISLEWRVLMRKPLSDAFEMKLSLVRRMEGLEILVRLNVGVCRAELFEFFVAT